MNVRVIAVVALAGWLTLAIGCGPKKYDSVSLSSDEGARAKAGSYWKKQGWWKLPAQSNKKVVITEFTVQYVTDRNHNISQNQLGLLAVAEAVGVGKRQYQFDEAFKKQLPSELYQVFTDKLRAAGYTVVPMEQVSASTAMDEVTAGEEGAKKKMGSSKQKGEIYSAAGLDRMYDGFLGFGAAKHHQLQAKVMHETGAEIGMRVQMVIGLHKGQATVDEGSNVFVYSGLKQWGTAEKPNWGVETIGNVTATNTLYREKPVVDEKDFEAGKGDVYQVNENDYRTAIMEIFPPFSVMAIQTIQK